MDHETEDGFYEEHRLVEIIEKKAKKSGARFYLWAKIELILFFVLNLIGLVCIDGSGPIKAIGPLFIFLAFLALGCLGLSLLSFIREAFVFFNYENSNR